MTTLANVFRQEISRLARKEAKAQIDPLRNIATRHRSELAKLKREIEMLQKELRATAREKNKSAAVEQTSDEASFRFSAAGLRRHRVRLGLSADGLAKLLGVSGQSVYHWEQGKSRPRASQLPAIAKLRTLGKRQLAELNQA